MKYLRINSIRGEYHETLLKENENNTRNRKSLFADEMSQWVKAFVVQT